MGDASEIVIFSLPILLIALVVIGLCCTFFCYLLRTNRSTQSLLSSDVEQQRPLPTGLKKVNYRNKWFQKTNLKDDICTICLDDFKGKEEINICKCGHAYHHKCIMKWLEIKDTCPICQRNVMRKTRTTERTPLLGASSLEV